MSKQSASPVQPAGEERQLSTSGGPCTSKILSVSLAIHPSSLEQRFWLRRCNSRLRSLDALFELCNTLVWLSILSNLVGTDRVVGKASVMLAITQLAAIHLTPQVWLQHRSLFISVGLMLRSGMLLLQLQPTPEVPLQSQAYVARTAAATENATGDAIGPGSGLVVAAGFMGNLLFVLFHQQPVRLQVPLLALSAVLQAWCTPSAVYLATPAQNISAAMGQQQGYEGAAAAGAGAGTPGSTSNSAAATAAAAAAASMASLGQALTRGFEQLSAGFLGGLNPGLFSPNTQQQAPSLLRQQTDVLAARLFLITFGGFVLPSFVAYIMEWKYKVAFLLSICKAPEVQLSVLTPAAAVVRGSSVLALMLYSGWLLMLAAPTWLLCSTTAYAVVAARL